MSHVTTLILVTSLNPWGRSDAQEEAEPAEIFVRNRCPSLASILDVGYYFGGTKAPQVEVFAGAFNFLDHGKVLAELRALPWEDGAVVQLVVNGEHDDGVYLVSVVGQPRALDFLP